MEISLSNKVLKEMGVAEVEKLIAHWKSEGMNTSSLERWLAIERGEIKREKRKPTKEVLAFAKGDIVRWTHKRKDYIGVVYKLNLVTVGVHEFHQPLLKWTIAPCYLTKKDCN